MVLDRTACHAAVRSRDARFDGVFYTAVKTTGIYCRPICPAKTPKAENCAFFDTAAAAEAAGFRPCLRCHPELSPADRETSGSLARRFVHEVQMDGLFGERLETAAARLGVSSRHLRRTVEQECGVSPLAVVETTRLLFARRLLSTTALPISQIAFGSGFGSLARFNYSFRTRYGTTPGAFRRETAKPAASGRGVRLALACREPFAWQALLAWWTKRAIPGLEAVLEGRYYRTVRIGGRTGWFAAGPVRGGTLEVEVADELATHLLPLAGRVRAMFDLDANPAPIAAVLMSDPAMRPLVEKTPGLRVPGAFDSFELAVRAILGQQVTVAAAGTLAGRLVSRFAAPAPELPAGLTHYPLEPAALACAAASEIAAIGIPLKRAETLRALAAAVAAGDFDYARVTDIPGIGAWTRDYIAMRALRWPDAFPAGDLGIRKALASLGADPERWRPWRAYGAMYLWTL
jgi:AraC family transcriptional regulator of adaptative response / DNA-3-methyladenine glycosylase II